MKNLKAAETWFNSPRGQALLRQEREHLESAVESLFGRTVLQIGDWAPDLIKPSASWRSGVLGQGPHADVICDPCALPLPPNSIDTILLAHSLESAPSAHRLLREVDQALSQRGQLLILGFNPFSWSGLCRRFFPWYPMLPERRRLLSRVRIYDWLRLLDYEVVECERIGSTAVAVFGLQKILNMFAPIYLIRARKRRIPLNPSLKPMWARARSDMGTARLGSARLGARGRSSVVVPFADGADS